MPRGRLSRLREASARDGSLLRARIMEATLVACGELGYRNVRVQDILDRYGGHRSQFYSHFASKAGCYAAAFEDEVERRYAELENRAAEAADRREVFRRVVEEIARFVVRQPLLARGLLVEVHLAGPPALERRDELLQRLALALDTCLRVGDPESDPPAVTASFLVAMIEAALARALTHARPQEFAESVPELIEIVLGTYGADRAGGERLAEPSPA